jgi:signal transduction histidine kinase
LGEPLSSALYRIAQEALTNVARHAQATEVRVGIRIDGDRLVVTIRDNGRGFDPNAAKDRKSYGILGIRERAYTLGGVARIESRPGGGTVVEVVIPVARYRRREASDGTGTAG